MKTILTIKAILLIGIPMYAQQALDWTPLNLNEPANLHSRSISVVDANIVWGTLKSSSTSSVDHVFLTVDGGENFDVFTLPFTNSGVYTYHVSALDENTAYTASSTSSGEQIEGVHRTTDGGQNWDLIFSNADEDLTTIKVHFFNAFDGFVSGFTGVFDAAFYYTSDGGDTWVQSESVFDISNWRSEGGNDGMTAVGDTAWISGVNNQVFRSVDKGITWTSSPIGTSGRIINDIAFKNNNEGLAISSLLTSGNNAPNILYNTEDGGVTWAPFSTLPNTVDANVLSYIPETEGGYMITSGDSPLDDTFLFTLDNGSTWSEGVAPYSLLSAEFLSPTMGYGTTETNDGGLLKFNDDIFSVSTSTRELNKEDIGLQVYPNPTTSETTIEYVLEKNSHVILEITDARGQLISQFLNETQPQGEHRFIWNAEALPAGVYFYTISIDNERYTGKVILLN